MNYKKYKYYAGDFETTSFEGQEYTEVWSSAFVELFDKTDNVTVHHSLKETIEYFTKQKFNICIYYHNLKFDGSFIIDYLLRNGFTQAFNIDGNYAEAIADKYMENNSFKYVITELGQWFTITVRVNNHFIIFRDSLKLLPFKLEDVGISFKTLHQKLTMEYKGKRYSGCYITDSEMEYIKNDVLVLKEALEIMFNEGHNELTIGSCCLKEFKSTLLHKEDYEIFFPDLSQITIDNKLYGSSNADEYIRKSYHGGWCYVKPEKSNKIIEKGLTADVNSLYPSEMHSESGNKYPIGKPVFWKGEEIPEICYDENIYFFVRFKCRFKIKPDYLPFIQIKTKYIYQGNEMLTTSDYYDDKTGKYSRYYYDKEGVKQDTVQTLTMTMTDYKLFREHYTVSEFQILDGCYFRSVIGLFDKYINKYRKIKIESKGAKRTLAKLFLNNLYGKFASSKKAPFKVAYLNENKEVKFKTFYDNEKNIGYIPIGSAITSYARNFTIRTAQKNYKYFIYADTDSIHCECDIKNLVDVPIDPVKFCHWKIETLWDKAIFVRQKTYIEHVTHEDMELLEKPYYNIKCAGMPDKCKNLLLHSIEQDLSKEELNQYNEEEQVFLNEKRDLKDFKVGLKIYGKLTPKRIYGGVILVDTTFKIKEG